MRLAAALSLAAGAMLAAGCNNGSVSIVQNTDGSGHVTATVRHEIVLMPSESDPGGPDTPRCSLGSDWGARWDSLWTRTADMLGPAGGAARHDDNDDCSSAYTAAWTDDSERQSLADRLSEGGGAVGGLVPVRNEHGGWTVEVPGAYFTGDFPSDPALAEAYLSGGRLSGTAGGTLTVQLPGERLYDNAGSWEPVADGGLYTWDLSRRERGRSVPSTLYADTAAMEHVASNGEEEPPQQPEPAETDEPADPTPETENGPPGTDKEPTVSTPPPGTGDGSNGVLTGAAALAGGAAAVGTVIAISGQIRKRRERSPS